MNDVQAIAAPVAEVEDIRDRSSVISRTFSSLKWLLALTVVADHFLRQRQMVIFGVDYDSGSYPAMPLLEALIVSFLKNYAVPVFFFMSGYLFAPAPGGYSAALKRSLRRLVVPFIVWCCFGLLMIILHYLPSLFKGTISIAEVFAFESGDIHSSPLSVITALLGIGHPFPLLNTPLWYIRDLCLMLLLVPVVDRVADRVGWGVLAASFGLLFICLFYDQSSFRVEVGLCFFFLGYQMRRNGVNMVGLFRKLFPFAAVAYPLLAMTHFLLVDTHFESARIAKNVNICVALPLFVYGVYLLVERGWLRGSAFLASASFMVYVMHHPAMWIGHYVFFPLFRPADGSALGFAVIIMAYAALILVPVGLYALLARFAPSVAAFLTGRR